MESTRGIVAAIALGSNLGDRHSHMAAALVELAGLPRTRLLTRSAIVQTAPVPLGAAATKGGATADLGGPYLNAVALVRTSLQPAPLLDELLRIERSLGRTRDPAHRALPRTIDLDLLVHGSTLMNTPALTLPHPRLHEREFVLRPLSQIVPGLVIPGLDRTAAELLDALTRADERSPQGAPA